MFHYLNQLQNIAAILPYYTSEGDATRIITTNGTVTTAKSRIRTVIRKIALSGATDLIALKKRTAGVTQRAILHPLPLATGLVLCPVKVRIPRVGGDTSTGYINYYAVKSIEKSSESPYQSTIHLIGGNTLNVMWTISTVQKHLQDARLALTYAPPGQAPSILNESTGPYAPQIVPIIQKFVEVICEIVAARQR